MRAFQVGHISEALTVHSESARWVALAVVGFAAVLSIEHLVVKHGRRWAARNLRAGCAATVAIALMSVVAAPAGAMQFPDPLGGLPDLVSDPPFLWITRNVEFGDGSVHRVLAFDGFLHNIGEGMLDVYGNPQIPGDVKQRVFDGETWEDVATPTVRYETNDGHNHFHLIAAVDYALWDDGQTQAVDPASKVGFCLVDTEQMEERLDSFYDIDRFNYCNADEPDATELRMGISPGWRDTYESTTTLQWVDVSEVAPGRYWVAAVTDPNNEIVESNEDNNGLVFSRNKFSVSGFIARDLDRQTANEPIELKTRVYGTVGDRAFVIVDPPTNGTLNVPAGVDLFDSTVTYTPDAGFEGTDEFSYYAHDTEIMFPLNPTIVTVTIDVEAAADGRDADPDEAPGFELAAPSQPIEVNRFEPVEVTIGPTADLGGVGTWFAGGLPPGLRIDSETGTITGTPSTRGSFESRIVLLSDGQEASVNAMWQVGNSSTPHLLRLNDLNTSTDEDLRIFAGSGNIGSEYEGSGFPPGSTIVPNVPLVVGRPEEIGRFDVEVREIVDGEVVDTISFVWTVRPAAIPAFPV